MPSSPIIVCSAPPLLSSAGLGGAKPPAGVRGPGVLPPAPSPNCSGGGAGPTQHREGCFWQPGQWRYLCFPPSLCRGSGGSGSQYCFVMMPANSPLVPKEPEPAAEVGRGEWQPPPPHAPTHAPTHPRTPSPAPSTGYRCGRRHSAVLGLGDRAPRPLAAPHARPHALGCALRRGGSAVATAQGLVAHGVVGWPSERRRTEGSPPKSCPQLEVCGVPGIR